jgi:hypothetical protein
MAESAKISRPRFKAAWDEACATISGNEEPKPHSALGNLGGHRREIEFAVLSPFRIRAIAQGAVSATRVIEGFDIVEDHQFSGGFCRRNRVGEAFGFQRSDEAFSQGVVIRIALAAHAWSDAPGSQAMLEGIGGILAAAITVVDKTNERSLTAHRVLEGPRGQLTEHVLPAVVCDAAARTGIESKGQIKPALLGLDVGDIALPELARTIRRRHLCQPVFRDLAIMVTLGGARPETALLPGAQAALPHKPGNPVLATAMTQLAQIEPHPRAAIGVSALFKALSDQDSQLGVFFPTLTILLAPMRGKAAFADIEGLTQSVGAILMLELFHHREACGGISADKMPKAFLKCHAVGSHTPVPAASGAVRVARASLKPASLVR